MRRPACSLLIDIHTVTFVEVCLLNRSSHAALSVQASWPVLNSIAIARADPYKEILSTDSLQPRFQCTLCRWATPSWARWCAADDTRVMVRGVSDFGAHTTIHTDDVDTGVFPSCISLCLLFMKGVEAKGWLHGLSAKGRFRLWLHATTSGSFGPVRL